MALGLKELRCFAPLPPDRTGSLAEVAVVMEGKQRGRPVVHVRFEPSRTERECLAGAYEQVVPVRRRVVVPIETRPEVARAPMLQRVGGVEK